MIRSFCVSLVLGAISVPAMAIDCGDVYRVEPGDTLSRIAGAVYGDVLAYPVIHEANRSVVGQRPEDLRVGVPLYIPCRDGRGVAQTDSVAPAALTAVDAIGVPQAPALDPLTTVEALAPLAQGGAVQLLDIRANAGKGQFLPGSVHIAFNDWRGAKENRGSPPSDEDLSRVIGAAGLRLDAPIVVLPSDGAPMSMARAAWVYWVLKSAGAERLALLDGGVKAWGAASLPLAETPVEAAPYQASVALADTWRATLAEVDRIKSGDARGTLVDGRPAKMFTGLGKGGAFSPSTLPGARNMSAMQVHAAAHDDGDRFLALFGQLKEQNVLWETAPVVNFCSTGELGALNWFYASEVTGLANVKLFPESAHGWKVQGKELELGGGVSAF